MKIRRPPRKKQRRTQIQRRKKNQVETAARGRIPNPPEFRRRKAIGFLLILAGITAGAVFALAQSLPSPSPPTSPGASPPPLPANPAEKLYLRGAKMFMDDGPETETSDLLLAAVKQDPRCLNVIMDPQNQNALPLRPCREIAAPSFLPAGDPRPLVLLRLAEIKKNRASQAGRPALLRKAGRGFLRRLVEGYPGTPAAEKAELILTENDFCLTDAGYKECLEWEIRGYETWLKKNYASPLGGAVVKVLAEKYWMLAERYMEDQPWRSPEKAELCRGRALQLARRLSRGGHQDPLVRWAEEFTTQVRKSGKPYSLIPESALPLRNPSRQ